MDLQGRYRERFQKAQHSALVLRIIDLAFERLARIVSDIAAEPGVTYQGVANNIAKLVKAGIAEEIGDCVSGDFGGVAVGGVRVQFLGYAHRNLDYSGFCACHHLLISPPKGKTLAFGLFNNA